MSAYQHLAKQKDCLIFRVDLEPPLLAQYWVSRKEFCCGAAGQVLDPTILILLLLFRLEPFSLAARISQNGVRQAWSSATRTLAGVRVLRHWLKQGKGDI